MIWWIQVNPSLATPGGAGTNPIEAATNQFVLYNFSAESITYEQAAFAIPDITINRAESLAGDGQVGRGGYGRSAELLR